MSGRGIYQKKDFEDISPKNYYIRLLLSSGMKVILILALTVLFFSFPNVVGQAGSQDLDIVIDSPIYPIEGRLVTLTLSIVNKGSPSSDGILLVNAEKNGWSGPETRYDVTDLETIPYTFSFEPTDGAGEYIINIIYHDKDNYLDGFHRITVRSYYEAVGAAVGILAMLGFAYMAIIFFLRRKNKIDNP